MAVAELVGGPHDGLQFQVPEPPPWKWVRRPDPQPVPFISDAGDTGTINISATQLEQYGRDLRPRGDGVWPYRWEGVK